MAGIAYGGPVNVYPVSDRALGNSAYLVDIGDGLAVSVDPRRDADDHLALAAQKGLSITAVLETHLHADFVSGAREIAASTGATVVAPDSRYADHKATPGEPLQAGRMQINVLATPGHTPEHVAYLFDGTVFTGGSLIAGGAARTDLSGEDLTDRLTRAQFHSLRALASLPENTAVHPTHGGGSFCSSAKSQEDISTTIAEQRATNPLLAIGDEDAFSERLQSGFQTYPRYFSSLREVNRLGAPLVADLPAVPSLSGTQAAGLQRDGAWLIDARPTDDWAPAHPSGAISIAFRDAFASWLGWVVPFGERIVLLIEEDAVPGAVTMARRIGYDAVEGWLSFATWRDAGMPVSSVQTLRPVQAREHGRLVDVRQAAELSSGRAAGAEHLELGDIIAGELPSENDVVTYCGHGERSATAASLLERRGLRVANLRGGISAWRSAGFPIEK